MVVGSQETNCVDTNSSGNWSPLYISSKGVVCYLAVDQRHLCENIVNRSLASDWFVKCLNARGWLGSWSKESLSSTTSCPQLFLDEDLSKGSSFVILLFDYRIS